MVWTNEQGVKVLKAKAGDWVGLYVDGRLINEGHSLSVDQVLSAVGVSYEAVEADFEMAFGGKCPEDFSDVAMALVSMGVGRS